MRVGDIISGYLPQIPDSAVPRGRVYISPPLTQTFCGEKCPYDSTVRAKFIDNDASIYSWPSRGGLIVLDNAEAIDFEGSARWTRLSSVLTIKPSANV